MSWLKNYFWSVGLVFLFFLDAHTQQLAFPGATGFGKFTQGGRGGRVIYVENLNSSGPGSFREALESSGPRTVVFRVGGTIEMGGPVVIRDPYITIAGQTAPGDGILLKGGAIRIKTSEVIIRNIRLRMTSSNGGDAITIAAEGEELRNIILDHCSISWGSDENIGINGAKGGLRDVTIQYSIIGEGLLDHSMGILANKKLDGIGPDFISIHNNLFVSNKERNPTIGTDITATVINNLVHNFRTKGSFISSGTRGDIIFNKYTTGNDTQAPERALEIASLSYVYLNGNDLPMGIDATSGGDQPYASPTPSFTADYGFTPLTDMNALESHVLSKAGAFPHDAVDTRMINDYINGTGKLIYAETERGGFPTLNGGPAPQDSDLDGMPDEWESQNGFNPLEKDGNGDHDGDGYTNLEEYLNCLMGDSCNEDSPGQPAEPVNSPPWLSYFSDLTESEGTPIEEIPFQVYDNESDHTEILLTAVSENQGLVRNEDISFSGTESNRLLHIVPVPNTTGQTTITVTASDGELSTTRKFVLSVFDLPEVSSLVLVDAETDEDIMTLQHGMNIQVTDLPTMNLNIRAEVLPPSGVKSVVFDWNGESGFVTENVAPYSLFGDTNGDYGAELFSVGTYEIRATPYTEDNGGGLTGKALALSFTIIDSSVPAENTAPTMSAIADQETEQDQSTAPITFTVGDAETDASDLVVTAVSSNQGVVSNAGIVLSGTAESRSIQLTPVAGATGQSEITVTVSDGELTSSVRFMLTVTSTVLQNTAPTISAITDQETGQDQSTALITFTVGDVETDASDLVVTAVSSNQEVVSNAGIVLSGTAESRSIQLTPVAGVTGQSEITVTVNDGELTSSVRFMLTVTSTVVQNTAPNISPIADQQIEQDQSTIPLAFMISDEETTASNLIVSAVSSDQNVIRDSDIILSGTEVYRTIQVTPVPGAGGQSEITVSVSDGELSSATRFVVTVMSTSAQNTPPEISSINDQEINEGTSTDMISFYVKDKEDEELIVTAYSNNETLVDNFGIVLGGSNDLRYIVITPIPGRTGSVDITVEVSDGEFTASNTFEVRVNASSSTRFNENAYPMKVFTPNGDMDNELWIYAMDPEEIEGCPLKIFNKQGQLVYEAVSYDNTWDGTSNGSSLEQGVYYYLIQCDNAKKGKNSGSITLIR